jgi:hypothetical protein
MKMSFEQVRAMKRTPAEVAAFTFRLTGGKPNPEATAETFRKGAVTMREYAAKAAASKSGTYRGYTEAQALELAAEQEERAVSVPAELRKLMA